MRSWLLALAFATQAAAQTLDAPQIYSAVSPSVFRIASRYGQGTGFLADRTGLVITNAHVITGSSHVTVQVDDSVRVEGVVAAVDPTADVAIVRINPSALHDQMPLPFAAHAPAIGDAVAALGFPLVRGPVLTTGRVSYVLTSTIMLDLNLNPGNSGGPVVGPDGKVVGMATFSFLPEGGLGLAGAIAVPRLDSLLDVARAARGEEPEADRLPVLSLQPYPWESLNAAARAEKWPEDVYDISGGTNGSYLVELFTPPFTHRRITRGDPRATDLTRYQLDLGQYPPAVILRITPRVGESALGTIANIVGGFAAGYSGTRFTPIYSPEIQGDIETVTVERVPCPKAESCVAAPVRTTLELFTTLAVNGQRGDAAYILLDPEIFAPAYGEPARLVITVKDRRGPNRGGIWSVPVKTVTQVWADFAPVRDGS